MTKSGIRSAAATAVEQGRAEPAAPLSLMDRLREARARMILSPGFVDWIVRLPLFGWYSRKQSRDVFDLAAGFTYTQTLTALLRGGVLHHLAEGPQSPSAIGERAGLPPEGVRRLVRAGLALGLLTRRSGGRVGLGQLGASVLANPAAMRMIEHNTILYRAITDPLATLRGEETDIARYYAYAETEAPERLSTEAVGPYSALMAGTLQPLIAELFASGVLDRARHIMDVGGGEGVFAVAAAARRPAVKVTLFDLPAVCARAAARIADAGLTGRVLPVGGNFHDAAFPTGADTITLIRVLLDHDDDAVRALLRKVHAALPPGGRLVVAEPMAGVRGSERVGEVYFGFFLRAMGQGRTREPGELQALLREAGFAKTEFVSTRYPVSTSIIVATA